MKSIESQKLADVALAVLRVSFYIGILAAVAALYSHPARAAITPPPHPPVVIVEPDLPTPEERESARKKAAAQRQLRAALNATIADTRTNIAETAELTDEQIAGLYLRQMKRDVTPLVGRVPTNTVEYLVGAGMRIDIADGATNGVPVVATVDPNGDGGEESVQ